MMNSSFLIWGQTGLASLACLTTVSSLLQFGIPRDTVRALAFIFSGTLATMLLIDALSWWGVFLIFRSPNIYGVLLGIMGFAWPSFIWLGVVDRPGQLRRKIMWRLPLVGALLGFALGSDFTVFVFVAGWLIGLGLAIYHFKNHRYVLRNFTTQALIVLVYAIVLRAGHLLSAQLCFAVWIVFGHRIINAFLVKNHIRNALEVNT